MGSEMCIRDRNEAIAVNITNKCFDEYEYALVRDVVMTRFAQ